MNPRVFRWVMLSTSLAVCCAGPVAHAKIDGLMGSTFNLTAKTGYIQTPDGGSYLMWGYANGTGNMQYPGPTLIVNQNDVITVNLTNQLTVPVSIVFPGQTGVTASGGSAGLLANEADPGGGTVTYSFTATEPGTYMYHSGTSPELQIEMGLVGAIIVRPTGFNHMDHMTWTAYGHPDSKYDREVLFLETEIDPDIHELVEQGRMAEIDTTTGSRSCGFSTGVALPIRHTWQSALAAAPTVQLHADDSSGAPAADASHLGRPGPAIPSTRTATTSTSSPAMVGFSRARRTSGRICRSRTSPSRSRRAVRPMRSSPGRGATRLGHVRPRSE